MGRMTPAVVRWVRVGLLASMVVFGAFGISRIGYNVDLLELLPGGLPGVGGTAVLQEVFERPDEMLVTLRAEGDADLEELAEGLAKAYADEPGLVQGTRFRPGWESRQEALVDLVAYAWWNAPADQADELLDSLAGERIGNTIGTRVEGIATSLDPVASTLVANDLLGLTGALQAGVDPAVMESFADGGFSNADGSFRVMRVSSPSPVEGYRAAAGWLERLKAVTARWQAGNPAATGVEVRFTGQPAFQAEIGSGMQRDMTQSVSGITFIVGFLFWLLHRRVKPLVLLMAAILGTGLITLGVAGLLFGSLNVMSMGFAAILMGMIEDFGVMGLNESMERPGLTYPVIHRRVAPPVWWSAVTSAAVFATLGLSSLPGIAQMGILTAIGILIGAAVMLYGFLPIAMKLGCPLPSTAIIGRLGAHPGWTRWAAAGLGAAGVVVLVVEGLPPVITGSAVLRPRHCEAFEALEEYQREMLPDHGRVSWVPVVARADDPAGLVAALRRADECLAAARGNHGVLSHFVPLALAPDAARQQRNAPRLTALAADRARVFREADRAGVTEQGLALARGVFARWEEWGREPGLVRWPDLRQMDEIIGRQLHRADDRWAACGYVRIEQASLPQAGKVLEMVEALPGIDLAGWDYLGGHLASLLGSETRRVLLPAAVILGVLMLAVFRGWRERVIAVVSLGFSGLVLVACMSGLGVGWNFVNIGAIPLCLGLGLDFHIHMIHALRHAGREGGSTLAVSRALAYCGLSTGLAFGALAFAGNQGLSTFGICAMIGVLAALFSAAFLVPALWQVGGKKCAEQ